MSAYLKKTPFAAGLLVLSFCLAGMPGPSSAFAQAQVPTPRSALVEGPVAARIDFRPNSGLITIAVRINGSKDLRMYLDTGMSAPVVLLFHNEAISELGLKSAGQVQIGGAGGEGRKPAALAPGATVEIGRLRMANQTLVVMTESRLTSDWPVDGVIGKTLFDRYLAEIDYENSVLTLYEPEGAKIVAETAPIPLDLATGLPVIEAVVGLEGGKEIPLRFAVDIGHRSALSLNEDGEKGVLPPEHTIKSIAGRGLQGKVPALIGRVNGLKLGAFELKNIPTAFLAPETNAGLSRAIIGGNIGSLIWRRFRILLDYPERKMFLVPDADFGKPFPFNMAGLVLEQDRESIWFVRHVIENSPAAKSGIQEGDRITAVDGVEAGKYPYDAFLELFSTAGREVKLTLERNGQVSQITLRLERLI